MTTPSRPSRIALGGVAVGIAVAAYLLWPPPPPAAGPGGERLTLRQVMAHDGAAGGTAGYARAIEPPDISFPRDHGPHPRFQTEWWYFTGNLTEGSPNVGNPPASDARDGRFGYQLTFFRSALRPPPPAGERIAPAAGTASAWRTDQLFMAHFALTDASEGRFHAFERFARGALDLAGARLRPFRVWLEDWSVEARDPESLFPLSLRAAESGVRLELTLAAGKPAVLQGEDGLSRKGATPGNASYYYSFTRLPTRGRLEVAGRDVSVTGSSWLDREWSTSALEPGIVGWDWFALQLSDGRELMFYQLRRADGDGDSFSGGTVAEADGSYRRLRVNDVALTERRNWRSPTTGAIYPAGWRLSSPAAGVDLEITPLVDSQEHTSTVLYWEGAVNAAGTSGGRAVDGFGYVELTGYDPTPATQLD